MADRKLVKPSELDIYYEPEETVRIVTAERQPAFLYETVSNARKRITKGFSGVLTTHEKVSNAIAYLETKARDLYSNGLNDPYSLLVPGSIALATLGGAAIAGRGKRPVRRSVYAGLFGSTAGAVTHHETALQIASNSYYGTVNTFKTIYSSLNNKKTITEKVEKENVVSESKETEISEFTETLDDKSTPVVNNTDNIKEPNEMTNENQVMSFTENTEMTEEVVNVETATKATTGSKDEDVPKGNKEIEEKEDFNDTVKNDDSMIQNEDMNSLQKPIYEPKQEDILVITERSISSDEEELKDSFPSDEIQFIENEASIEKVEKDLGQSDPSDIDMYSTRK